MRKFTIAILLLAAAVSVGGQSLKVSSNGRYFTENGKPFFWLGDTGWLLFKKVSREETIRYLDTRQRQGFNVVQAMLLHDLKQPRNFYGDAAIEGTDVSKPVTTPGNRFSDENQYDYWDHVDWVVDQAAKRGIYMALVPVWGSNVKAGLVSDDQARSYAEFLAKRYRGKRNIIWLNGGDLRGDDHISVWRTIGETLRRNDPNHLITFHPRGRTGSSEWFHNESWLDFNMFQSGHRNYAQDNSPGEHHFGEDNWRYAAIDWNLKPTKPTLDAEPSYENIPQGLHDPKMPRWNDADVRRYAYWSVFAGGAGFTYGENSMIQFYTKDEPNPAYGAEIDWHEAINAKGANQMRFLKSLMMSKTELDRSPGTEFVANQGERYQYIAATKGRGYALFYTFTGRTIKADLSTFKLPTIEYRWFDPRTGTYSSVSRTRDSGVIEFDPPGAEKPGNDWVLIVNRRTHRASIRP